MAGAEWRNRTDFAQHAEALGLTTDSIMSVMPLPDGWAVLFTETPTADPNDWTWLGILKTDHSGILQVTKRYRWKRIADLTAELNAHMARLLEQHQKGEN